MSENNQLQKYERYSPSYSEKSFWNKIKRVAHKAGIKVIYAALLLYFVMVSSSTPIKAKTKIIGVLGYFILPLDMIPDFIPLVGYSDDLAALMWGLKTVSENITPEIEALAKDKLGNWFSKINDDDLKDIINDFVYDSKK